MKRPHLLALAATLPFLAAACADTDPVNRPSGSLASPRPADGPLGTNSDTTPPGTLPTYRDPSTTPADR